MTRRVWSALLFPLLIVALATTRERLPAADDGNAKSTVDRLIGTWKLVSAKYGDEDAPALKSLVTLKHVTPSGFVWLSYDAETRVVSRSAGGTYTVDGDKYIETPNYGFGEDFDLIRDKKQTFDLKMDGDTWHHRGALSNGLVIDEAWERCKRD